MAKLACVKLLYPSPGENDTLQIPVENVHHFDETAHNPFRTYKIDLGYGQEARHATLMFITNSVAEMNEILEKGKRQRVPNKKYIIPPRDTTTDNSEQEVQTLKNPRPEMQQNMHVNISARLNKLKTDEQRRIKLDVQKKTFDVPKVSGVKKRDPLSDINFNSIYDSKRIRFPRSKPEETAPDSRQKSKNSISSILKKMPSTNNLIKKQSSALNMTPPPPSKLKEAASESKKNSKTPTSSIFMGMPSSNDLIRNPSSILNGTPLPLSKAKENVPESRKRSNTLASPIFKPPELTLTDNRLCLLKRMADEMDDDVTRSLENEKKKVARLSETVRKFQLRFQEIKEDNAVLHKKLNESEQELQLAHEQIAGMDEEMKNVKRFNEDWQRVAINKCEAMHAIFSEWKLSQEHLQTNVTYAPVGYVTEDENHIHLGRGVWVSCDAYLMAASNPPPSNLEYEEEEEEGEPLVSDLRGVEEEDEPTVSNSREEEEEDAASDLPPSNLEYEEEEEGESLVSNLSRAEEEDEHTLSNSREEEEEDLQQNYRNDGSFLDNSSENIRGSGFHVELC